MKPFEKWKHSEISKTFGIRRLKSHPVLSEWLTTKVVLNDDETTRLAHLQAELREEIDNWQEDELKSFFIMPVLHAINFRQSGVYKIFTQRLIEATLQAIDGKAIDLKGRVEAIVAAGTQEPEEPFLFVHEYKPQSGSTNDPLGQLLAAMLVAQKRNIDPSLPLYGLYVIGRFWFFVGMQGKEYAVSEAYDASVADLTAIGTILKARKMEIDEYFIQKGVVA